MTSNQGYARPELLVETDWLAEHAQDGGLRIIDCATNDAYNRAHIPGAVGLGFDVFNKDPANATYVLPPDTFAELMGRLGVGDDTLVVTYDDHDGLNAARMWWVLQHYGHPNAKILNGGWHKWLHESRPITNQPLRAPPATFTPKVNEAVICSLDDLDALVGNPDANILDVRTMDEYTGANDRGNKRAGHVPGAAHIEWIDFITHDDRHVFKPAADIKEMLGLAGITPEKQVVTY